MNHQTGKVEITAQNHNLNVDPDSLDEKTVEKTHTNLNDQTLAGLGHKTDPIFSVQYHPEASPGPPDRHYLFTRFLNQARSQQGVAQLPERPAPAAAYSPPSAQTKNHPLRGGFHFEAAAAITGTSTRTLETTSCPSQAQP